MGGRWTYRISATGVLVLAAAAFTLSYDALHQLALDSRVRPDLAWLWPVVIDGTIVVALLTVLAAKRVSARTGYPWTLAGLFSLASVAFNIAHAPDRPVAQLVFAMAPVALVLTTHLLMQQASWRHRRTEPNRASTILTSAEAGPVPATEAASTSGQATMTPGSRQDRRRPDPDLEPALAGQKAATTGPELDRRTPLSGLQADLRGRAQQIYEEHQAAGGRVSGAGLARELRISERHGRRLLAEFRAKDEGSAGRNGNGAARHQQASPMPR
jgi:Protein of unknown function (DUF2637)